MQVERWTTGASRLTTTNNQFSRRRYNKKKRDEWDESFFTRGKLKQESENEERRIENM